MIFALRDWFAYKTGRYPYSDAELRAQGGQLATHTAFPDPTLFKTGDVVFLHSRVSVLSWLVMYFTSSVWSHNAVFSEDGNVIDATLGGVVEHPFADYLDDTSYVAMRTHKVPLTDDQKFNILRGLRSRLGSGYNWHGVSKLFAAIVLGIHMSYRLRFTADILFTLGAISLFGLAVPVIAKVTLGIALLYVVTVLATTHLRRAMRARVKTQPFPRPGPT